jgi:hypothetical protein
MMHRAWGDHSIYLVNERVRFAVEKCSQQCVTWEERPRKAASSATEKGVVSSDLQTIEVLYMYMSDD